jgi:hypothetical protein
LPTGKAKALSRARAEAFNIEPNVLIDNRASNRFTVIEVNARDRPALLHQLARTLFQSRVTIHSAHVATYGERAVAAGTEVTSKPEWHASRSAASPGSTIRTAIRSTVAAADVTTQRAAQAMPSRFSERSYPPGVAPALSCTITVSFASPTRTLRAGALGAVVPHRSMTISESMITVGR